MEADRPITLITATPGGGKTALAVQIMQKAIDDGRPVFCMGIPDLKLTHFPCPPISEWTENRPDPDHDGLVMPYFTFPENSLVVLDEAQRVYRLRAAASKVPDHVAAFETVRHTGVTFLLMTQHPNFVDSHIRNLVGRHVHLRDLGLLGRWFYEWPEVGDPKQFATAPIKKKWKLPKESFSLYKSSSLHIKRNYAVPPAMAAIFMIGLAVVAGGTYLYRAVSDKVTPKTAVAAPSVDSVPVVAAPAVSAAAPSLDPSEMLVEFVPRIRHRPETAPAYDALRQVKYMPVVAGCVQTAKTCSCQTQTGVDAGLDDGQCRQWIKNPPFDPYRDPAPVATTSRENRPAAERQPSVSPDPAVLTNPPTSDGLDPRSPISTGDHNMDKPRLRVSSL